MVPHPAIKKSLQRSSFKRAERSAPSENYTDGGRGFSDYRLSAGSRQAQEEAAEKNDFQFGTLENRTIIQPFSIATFIIRCWSL